MHLWELLDTASHSRLKAKFLCELHDNGSYKWMQAIEVWELRCAVGYLPLGAIRTRELDIIGS